MTESFTVGIGTSVVEGDLTVPGDAAGVVVFAHGSGSSRHSPRNQAVARALQDHRFATLLLDMLSQEEDRAEAAGGRPDLAGAALEGVRCPVLLIVGGHDDTVRRLNKAAAARLPGTRELVVVPGAGHLFEEPGALEQVADAAAGWFDRHLVPGGGQAFTL